MQTIFSDRSSTEFLTDENCFITEIMNVNEHQNVSIAKARVLRGVTTKVHWLKNTSEYYYILQGQGEVEIDGQMEGIVRPGDVIPIPPNISQRIKNTGQEDLIFLC